jgi:preprotein translocase subunit YajC
MFNFLAETVDNTVPAGGGLGGTIIMLLAMVAIFYFMIIRPENKRKKEAEQLRSGVKVGDKITTIGGIVGTVVNVKEDKFVVETGADQVRIEFAKWALSTNESATAAAAEERKKAQEEQAKAVAAKKAEKANKKNR